MGRLRDVGVDMNLSELMNRWPGTVPVFLRYRMLCVGCLVTPFHTVSDACTAYDLDETRFWEELERAVSPGGASPEAPGDADLGP